MNQPPTRHPTTELLTAFGLGSLRGDAAQAVEAHVSECPTCCDALCTPTDDDLIRLVRTWKGGRPAGPTLRVQPGYEILSEIGRGGMGVVYKARQVGLDRVVALKRAQHDGDLDEFVRFRREAEAAARLHHPNIVQIYDVGEQDGVPYLAMEYVPGGTLHDHLDGIPIDPRVAAAFVATLARAVHHAHENGVVHRDLKPANILLGELAGGAIGERPLERLVPKVADFGLAKLLDRADGRTRTGAILGTPRYMAPEQAAQSAPVGPPADVHALGVLLYEALTGRPPFAATTTLDTLAQVLHHDPVPPRRLQPTVPADLETVCLQCLRKSPGDRYASAQAMADDLQRFLAGEPVLARPVGVWYRGWKWARRKPALAGLMAAVAVLLTSLLVGGWVVNARLRAEGARADANYHEARDTLTRIVARFEDRRLADVPRLKELRRDVIESALAYYERILRDADDRNPAVRFDAAVALEQASKLQAALGNTALAEANLRRAVALFERLPADDEREAHLAACHRELGLTVAARAGPGVRAVKETLSPEERATLAEADGHLRRALRLRDELHQRHPADRRRTADLAAVHFDLALVCADARDAAGEDAAVEAAQRLRAELWEADPADKANALALAEVHRHRGQTVFRRHRLMYGDKSPAEKRKLLPEVEAHYRRAEALLEPLAADPQDALQLARLWAAWGQLVRPYPDLGDRALDLYTRALGVLTPIVEREPLDAAARQALRSAHGGRAYLLQGQRRFADAVRDWDRVVELSTAVDRAFTRSNRAGAIAKAGDHARAAAEATALIANPEGSDDVVFNAATALAQAALACRTQGSDSAPPAAAYTAAMYDAFRRLQRTGYFRTAEHVLNLRTDPDLEPVRAQAEFQRLLRDVAP